MNHITDEQFEDILQHNVSPPAHLDQCQECQKLLAEKRAIAHRLRSAFNSVEPGADLADRIRSQFDLTAKSSQSTESAQPAWTTRLHKRIWSPLAAAAAMLVVAVPLGLYFASPSQAKAAQAELVKIHRHNLSPHREFYNHADPEKLAEYFKDKLGFTPAFPCTGQGMAIRGCCVAHFKGQIVGSYVVDTPRGIISVIVVTDTPKEIGMTYMPEKKGDEQSFWKSSYAQCNMVTVRLGGYSYCAIGEFSETSHQYLKDLLRRLLPQNSENTTQ